jgi:purine nucleoside phosphorylase
LKGYYNKFMNQSIDPTISYTGPKADLATVTGSPLWGLRIDDVVAAAKARGWQHYGGERLATPYGPSAQVHHFTTPAGRSVIWIPSYGNVRGEDRDLYWHNEKLFWVLWQAGVKGLIVGGTSGIADWRQGEETVQPGDVVLPWSFRTKPEHGGLPGTPFETFWPDHDVLLDEPFCPDLRQRLVEKFAPHVAAGRIRRLHTPDDVRVALVIPDAPTFESDFDILMWAAISRMASEIQPKQPPIVTLHGDCVNPVLARHLGIHVMYYHLVANYAQGMRPDHDIAATLYGLYLETFPQVALDVEFSLLEEVALPDGASCHCRKGVHEAPKVFRAAMTQREE